MGEVEGHSAVSSGFDSEEFGFVEDEGRARYEFGGRTLQQEHQRTLGMVRSPAQDRVRKLMGEGGFE